MRLCGGSYSPTVALRLFTVVSLLTDFFPTSYLLKMLLLPLVDSFSPSKVELQG